jgi:major membrane immunogen (membrane-anchored lipoprotein)
MKKNSVLYMALLVALMMIPLVSCQKKTETPAAVAQQAPKEVVAKDVVEKDGSYEDGIYFAAEDSFASNGWKEVVTLSVENGKITKADWNGVNVSSGPSKKAVDKAGKYNMKKFGGAQANWYEEAEKVEQYLIKTQDPAVISYKDDEGHTDDIAGVSVHVVAFFELAQKALANGPVGRGMYEDGAYYMADSEFPDNGWKDYVALTVINGNIVGANWSAIDIMGEDKKLYDAAGKYNMVKFAGAQSEWSVQAAKAEQYLIDIQDPSLVKYIDEEGHTDAISGVSIHISGFMTLADAALKAGPVVTGPYIDGGYYATKDAFDNGWKEYVSLFVKNGNIVNAYWSAVNEDGEDKKAFDMAGNYNMVKFGGAQSDWYEQAALVEQHLIDTQDVSAISYKDDAGHTDDIAGASIHVSGFYELVATALDNGVITIE